MLTQIPVAIWHHIVFIISRPIKSLCLWSSDETHYFSKYMPSFYDVILHHENIFYTKCRSYIHMVLMVRLLRDWLRLPVWLRWFNRIWLFACTDSCSTQLAGMLQIGTKMMLFHMHLSRAKCVWPKNIILSGYASEYLYQQLTITTCCFFLFGVISHRLFIGFELCHNPMILWHIISS